MSSIWTALNSDETSINNSVKLTPDNIKKRPGAPLGWSECFPPAIRIQIHLMGKDIADSPAFRLYTLGEKNNWGKYTNTYPRDTSGTFCCGFSGKRGRRRPQRHWTFADIK